MLNNFICHMHYFFNKKKIGMWSLLFSVLQHGVTFIFMTWHCHLVSSCEMLLNNVTCYYKM